MPMILRRTLVAVAVLACCCMTVMAQRPSSPSGSLLTVSDASGWSLGARAQQDWRELKSGGDLAKLDALHFVGRLGYTPTPSLFIFGEAGASYADVTLNDLLREGEYGLEWSLGARMHLVEYVLASSATFPRKQILGIAAGATYTSSESNAGATDFSWIEYEFVFPTIVYAVDRRADVYRQPYEEAAFTVEAGLVFAQIDGDYGAVAVEENRNFGLKLDADIWLARGWSVELDCRLFTASDRSASLAAIYHF